jgi:hypothetical protein
MLAESSRFHPDIVGKSGNMQAAQRNGKGNAPSGRNYHMAFKRKNK